MSGPKLAKMAWRNMWRNRRRTLVTLSGIVFGVLLAVLFTGLGDATYGNMINLAARIGGGHVSLQHPDALERGEAPKRSITGVTDKVRLALADPDVTTARVRITGHTMLGAGGNSRGAGFIAFDPAAEDRSTAEPTPRLSKTRLRRCFLMYPSIIPYRLSPSSSPALGGEAPWPGETGHARLTRP